MKQQGLLTPRESQSQFQDGLKAILARMKDNRGSDDVQTEHVSAAEDGVALAGGGDDVTLVRGDVTNRQMDSASAAAGRVCGR